MEINLFTIFIIIFFLGLIYYLIKNADKTILLSKKIEKLERKLSRLIQNNEDFTSFKTKSSKVDSQTENDNKDEKLTLADQIISDSRKENNDLDKKDDLEQTSVQQEVSETDDDSLNENEKVIEGFNNIDYNDMVSSKIKIGSGTFYDSDYSNIYNNYVKNNLLDINNISDDTPSESYLSTKCRGLKKNKKNKKK